MKDRATFLKMEMNDGSKVEMTLAFGRLHKLRQNNPEAYKKYNNLAMNGMKDELDFVTYLHAGYLCANIDKLEECMSEEEFIEKAPANHMYIIAMVQRLKVGDMEKKRDLGNLS